MFKQVLGGMVEANGSCPRHGADFASVFGPRRLCSGFRAEAVLASVLGLGCFWARFQAEVPKGLFRAVIHHFCVRGNLVALSPLLTAWSLSCGIRRQLWANTRWWRGHTQKESRASKSMTLERQRWPTTLACGRTFLS